MAQGRKNILFLTSLWPNHPDDQQGNYILHQAKALVAAGYRVDVLVARPYRPGWLNRLSPTFGNIDVGSYDWLNSFEVVVFPSIPRDYFRVLGNRLFDVYVRPRLHHLAVLAEADLIHVHGESMAATAASVAKALNIRSVCTIHGLSQSPRYIQAPAQRKFLGNALNRMDRVILVGEPLRQPFAELTGNDEHFRVVPNGYDLRQPNESACIDGDLRLISISNLQKTKGVDLTIRALAEIKDAGFFCNVTYTIVGDGIEKMKLEALAQQLGITEHVTFVGAVKHALVQDYLIQANVFILPSYVEAFGIAYLEAMSLGLLTIGVEKQGPSQFIRDSRNGFLVKPQSVESIVGVLKMISQFDVKQLRRVAMEGQANVRSEYTWQAHVKKLGAIYNEMMHAN